MPPRTHVKAGEPITLYSVDHNDHVDLYRRSLVRTNVPPHATRRNQNNQIVHVWNNTGEQLKKSAIVGLGDALLDNTAEVLEKASLFEAKLPNRIDHQNRFAVLPIGCDTNQTSDAVISGTAKITLDVFDETHDYADLKDDDATAMNSVVYGPARVLWKDTGEGLVDAVISFPIHDQAMIFGKASGDIIFGQTDNQVEVFEWSVDDNAMQTTSVILTDVGFLWMHGSQNISSGKEVLLARIRGNWHVIGAECE